MADEMNKNMTPDESIPVITLEFDDGDSMDCELFTVFDFEDKSIAVLMPVDNDEDVLLYEYVETDDSSFTLNDIEDDAFFERICEYIDSVLPEDE